MKTFTLNLPKMYGDHHVTEVRHIVSALPGVAEVYASSAFRVVEIHYDPAKLDADAIKTELDKAGYLGDLVIPVESGQVANGSDRANLHLRHSTTYEQTKRVVSFTQEVDGTQHPLWPCPGLGVIKMRESDDYG